MILLLEILRCLLHISIEEGGKLFSMLLEFSNYYHPYMKLLVKLFVMVQWWMVLAWHWHVWIIAMTTSWITPNMTNFCEFCGLFYRFRVIIPSKWVAVSGEESKENGGTYMSYIFRFLYLSVKYYFVRSFFLFYLKKSRSECVYVRERESMQVIIIKKIFFIE